MFAAAGKAEILTGVDDVFFTFVADDALAVKSEDQRVAGSGVPLPCNAPSAVC